MNAWEKKIQEDENRAAILKAALQIVEKSDWDGLNISSIAAGCNCSIQAVSRHFKSKEMILGHFKQQGYLLLYRYVIIPGCGCALPEARFKQIWKSYWDFAQDNEKYYRLIFGVGTHRRFSPAGCRELRAFENTLKSAILNPGLTNKQMNSRFYKCWSLIHDMVSLNFEEKMKLSGQEELMITTLIEALSKFMYIT